ncbi:MAG: DUF4954 family protein [Spirochaetes bacterium]|nr:DUF4954 family protein [Spirochaetota bacterium]
MPIEIIEQAKGIFTTSDVLQFCALIQNTSHKSKLFGTSIRPLTSTEVAIMEKQGNRCENWEKILVVHDFNPFAIHNCFFVGDCVIGAIGHGNIEIEPGITMPSHLSNSTIITSEIGTSCIVSSSLIAKTIICNECALIHVGSLTSSDETTFGNGIEIRVGNETGGREILMYAELPLTLAIAVAMERYNGELLQEYENFVHSYVEKCTSQFSIIREHTVIKNTPTIRNCYLGPYCRVDSAILVENVTALSSEEEPVEISYGAIVKDSCLQWGAHATAHAIVTSSLLMEHSHVERHGIVTHSIIGPNSGIAEGEVTSSFVGPFVGFHHQALLIAALWPDGKGNVGYGANVGSNHTGKAPDQEIICGEGLFFGLGVNIKFPADYSDSPYSIIATGVNALPQRVEFPFSLINTPSIHYPGISTAHNEILPGWVLAHNLYAVMRNEMKFRSRNRARHTDLVFEVFRPEIVDRMIIARNRLKHVQEIKPVYTASDILGLGKNYLLERNRKAGIDAYEYFIEYYLLKELAKKINELVQNGNLTALHTLYTTETEDADWEYVRKLLRDEGHHNRSITENLMRLCEMYERIGKNIQLSKEKDDGRGSRIILDYHYTHTCAREDPFVIETWEKIKSETSHIKILIAKCMETCFEPPERQ